MHIRQLLSKPKSSYFIYETKKNPRIVAAAAQSAASSAKAKIQTETMYGIKPANAKRGAELCTLVKVIVLQTAKTKAKGRAGTTELTTHDGEETKVKTSKSTKGKTTSKTKSKTVSKAKNKTAAPKKKVKKATKPKKEANPQKVEETKNESPEVTTDESESN